MLPVLEDSVLADRSQNNHFTIKDLLLYSSVCGTGLDTVPLPGDIRAEDLVPLLMDISALSLRLNKPLDRPPDAGARVEKRRPDRFHV